MTEASKPRDAKDVEEVVRAAIASEQPLEIIGHGTKRAIGHPMATNAVLDLSALNAVSAYEPNELIITVQAGAPLADVQSLIDSKNQQFAFEPMDTSALLGVSGNGTIGGMIGAGLAGPRRIKAGGARDHLLGAHAVSGFGDSFKTGGRVVKNVTGYDLCKLLAGSWGTLAVMTEVTLKVMPQTRKRAHADALRAGRRHREPGDDLGARLALRRLGRGAPAEFGVPDDRALGGLGAQDRAVTLLRLEGIAASVADRANSLAQDAGAIRGGGNAAGHRLGCGVGGHPRRRAVCRQRCARRLAGVADRLSAGFRRRARPGPGARQRRRCDLRLGRRPDLGGAAAEAGRASGLVRQRVEAAGGHATLIRASEQIRRNVDVFHPQAAGLAALSQRVGNSFDPKIILNRGRMLLRICDMKTEFSLAQLADPDIAEADKILRACVHCGFCTATCPTYVLLGDELDSPRGRIYLIKEMLEKDKPPTAEVVKHIDRCLSCLACMTTCPSGVHYMHLVDQARVRIERDYSRPLAERALRAVLALVLPRPKLFRASMIMARLARPFAALLPASNGGDAGVCCGGSRRCWRWRRAASRRRDPRAAASLRPSASGAGGSRCCRAAPSRCWRRASTRPPSIS